jgi:hypothetical protein
MLDIQRKLFVKKILFIPGKELKEKIKIQKATLQLTIERQKEYRILIEEWKTKDQERIQKERENINRRVEENRARGREILHQKVLARQAEVKEISQQIKPLQTYLSEKLNSTGLDLFIFLEELKESFQIILTDSELESILFSLQWEGKLKYKTGSKILYLVKDLSKIALNSPIRSYIDDLDSQFSAWGSDNGKNTKKP